MDAQKRLTGKTAVITGASRGIGAAIAKRFAAEGANIVITARTLKPGGRRKGSLLETADAIRALGADCLPIAADLADAESRAGIIDKAAAHFDGVDILINNAAWMQIAPIWNVPAKHLNLGFQVNVTAAHDLSRVAFKYMQDAGGGHIVNISSATANLPSPAPYDFKDRYAAYNRDAGVTIYGATKAALDRLTSGWAVEAQRHNIAVNALAPVAAVSTAGALAVGGWQPGDMEPPDTMAEAALQLCLKPAEIMTGRIAKSLDLLRELGIATKDLSGENTLKDFDFSKKRPIG